MLCLILDNSCQRLLHHSCGEHCSFFPGTMLCFLPCWVCPLEKDLLIMMYRDVE